jgi:hypothetical protein
MEQQKKLKWAPPYSVPFNFSALSVLDQFLCNVGLAFIH